MPGWESNNYSRLSVGAVGELFSETGDEPEPSETITVIESGQSWVLGQYILNLHAVTGQNKFSSEEGKIIPTCNPSNKYVSCSKKCPSVPRTRHKRPVKANKPTDYQTTKMANMCMFSRELEW